VTQTRDLGIGLAPAEMGERLLQHLAHTVSRPA